MDAISVGVCTACRRWAIRNMAPGQNDCICEPVGTYNGGLNNNEVRFRHLCEQHEDEFWRIIHARADREILTRLNHIRIYPKKRGHGWTRKKGTNGIRSPVERRRASRVTQPIVRMAAAAPNCYYGQLIGAPDHTRVIHLVPFPDTNRVRNCLGCNKFHRKW